MEYVSGMETSKIIEGMPSLKKIEQLGVIFYVLAAVIITALHYKYTIAFAFGAALFCFDYWLLKKGAVGIFKNKKSLFFIVSNFLRYLMLIAFSVILLFIANLNWIGFALGLALGPVFLVISVGFCILYEKNKG